MMTPSNGIFQGGIVIHHSLTADGVVLDNSKAIKRYHIEVNGWEDCGYHYLIEKIHGVMQIVTGRPIQYYGAHCPPNNSIGICAIGDFDKEKPSMETLMMLNRLCLGLMITYGFTPDMIHYHSEFSQKTCPGKLFPKEDFKFSLAKEYMRCLSTLKD